MEWVGGGFAHVFQMVFADDVAEPGGSGLCGDGVAFEVGEGLDRRIFVNHDSLGIVLHGCADGHERQAVGDSFEDLIAGAEAEVRATA